MLCPKGPSIFFASIFSTLHFNSTKSTLKTTPSTERTSTGVETGALKSSAGFLCLDGFAHNVLNSNAMNNSELQGHLEKAKLDGKILQSTLEGCLQWLKSNPSPLVAESISELVQQGQWTELNDRFYKTLAFGTGGLRGRTIGKYVTKAERGNASPDSCPAHTAVGSNCMNDFNVRRATMGLVDYIQNLKGKSEKVHLVFAHDTRHFSRHFAELAARTVIECGGKASLFESERSTPQLSFSVRQLQADGGVVVTASHNPPHDNGYKVYFNDGAQVVEPHATKIIEHVQAVPFERVCSDCSINLSQVNQLGSEIDRAYSERLRTLVLQPDLVRKSGSDVKIVYSPLHGTGAKIVPPVLEDLGFKLLKVPDQMKPDGRFPTVKSPNPENAEALSLGINLAEKEGADLVMATDPDADRMGVAVRNASGKMELLNGNQIGSLLAFYRLEQFFSKGVLNEKNRSKARLIKTVVTTDFQKAIAEKFGVVIPETLTGFKYIGEKLRKYEQKALQAAKKTPTDYLKLSEDEKRTLLLEHSSYYVFGGEESYGYSASDFCRDKDANAACLMFAELAVHAKSRGKTILDFLDAIYSELGYYQEKLGQLVYEGADGAQKIRNILRSYETNPPRQIAGINVREISNYSKQDIFDVEGEKLPKELLLFVNLENGSRYAVRGSGTEPKIKFYMFAVNKPKSGTTFKAAELKEVKAATSNFLSDLWKAIENDASQRAGA